MMQALEISEPHRCRVVTRDAPQPAAHELLVRVTACGICGTDVHILHGEYLGDYPVVPGHEFAGTVEAVGDLVQRFRPGDRVAVEPNISCQNCAPCLSNRENFCENWQAVGVTRPGAMAEYVAVPESAAFSVEDLDLEYAAFVEPLSCVLHGIERAGVRAADHVAIVGAGSIGILLLQAARLNGAAHIGVVERNAWRRRFALEAGADEAFADMGELARDVFDLVIDATGIPEVMARTLDHARPGGTVLLFGVPPAGAKMVVEPFLIFRKGLTVLSSFTSVRNSIQAVDLLRTRRIDVSRLVTHRFALEEFEQGVALIESGAEGVMKVLILPGHGES